MKVQIRQVAEMLAAGRPAEALKFAAKLNCLGDHKAVVQKGYAAKARPDFYRELGVDPALAEAAAMAALAELTAED